MKVVIDTNCLIPSIPRHNSEYWLYESFRKKEFDWVISNEVMSEYYEKLASFYSVYTANLVTDILLVSTNVIFAEPFYKWLLIDGDPDDNKFVDLCISSNANYLVTNDHHFDILKNLEFPKLNVKTMLEFKIIMGY